MDEAAVQKREIPTFPAGAGVFLQEVHEYIVRGIWGTSHSRPMDAGVLTIYLTTGHQDLVWRVSVSDRGPCVAIEFSRKVKLAPHMEYGVHEFCTP
jgi:hypothetical protein